MEVRAFTETISDTAVRYQITIMKESILVWIHQVDKQSGGNQASLPRLAASLPGTPGNDGMPAATVILGSRSDVSSEQLAARLARRYGIAVYACVSLGDVADLGSDVVFSRVVRELQALDAFSHGDSSQA